MNTRIVMTASFCYESNTAFRRTFLIRHETRAYRGKLREEMLATLLQTLLRSNQVVSRSQGQRRPCCRDFGSCASRAIYFVDWKTVDEVISISVEGNHDPFARKETHKHRGVFEQVIARARQANLLVVPTRPKALFVTGVFPTYNCSHNRGAHFVSTRKYAICRLSLCSKRWTLGLHMVRQTSRRWTGTGVAVIISITSSRLRRPEVSPTKKEIGLSRNVLRRTY